MSLEPANDFPGEFEHVHVTGALPHAFRYPAALPTIRKRADEFQPDLINAHFVPNYGVIASLLDRAPWVLSTWGSDIMTDPDKTPFHRWRTRAVLRRAAAITSDAEVMTKRITEFGVPSSKILTFPYGVDIELFHPGPPGQGPAPRILSNRKLEPVYDIGSILSAMDEVVAALPQSRLTIAGNGSQRQQLETLTADQQSRAAITFRGAVAHSDMPELLFDHDIFVAMPHSDTTSVSLLEAMACGLFPIVTDIPANHEWLRNGENGILVPVGDSHALASAVVSSWNNPSLRQRAREENLSLIRARGQWAQSMRPVEDLFARLAGSGEA
jgi:glycosyltransferase involved in cell wall biosynthesis